MNNPLTKFNPSARIYALGNESTKISLENYLGFLQKFVIGDPNTRYGMVTADLMLVDLWNEYQRLKNQYEPDEEIQNGNTKN